MTAESESALYMIATDDGSDPDYAASLETGLRLAERDGATVLLYDRTSESSMTDPYPVGPWSDEEDAVSEDTELDRQMLDNLGRHYLIDQIDEAEGRGLAVRAHLARGSGAEALDDAVSRYRPDLIVLPESVADPSLVDRMKGDDLKKFRHDVDTKVCLVTSSGELR